MNKDQLTLVGRTGLKNPSIQFWSDDHSKVEALKYEVRAAITRLPQKEQCNWFQQGDSTNWWMIEFWTEDHDAILKLAMYVAENVGMELEV